MNNILHIDDDMDFHYYVKTMLSDFVNITSVCTEKELQDALVDNKYDLFIIDLVLKETSGASIAQDLKVKYPDTPIVILSAHEQLVKHISEADATFVKSVLDYDDFIATIKKLLPHTD